MAAHIHPRQRLYESPKFRETVVLGICLLCSFLFLYTAYAKIIGHDRFLKGLIRIRVLTGLAVYISWAVPLTEVLIASLLILPKTFLWGLYAFTGLMVVFTGYITGMVLWADQLPCHCGGAIEQLSWTQHIGFNLAFIAVAIGALRLSKLKP